MWFWPFVAGLFIGRRMVYQSVPVTAYPVLGSVKTRKAFEVIHTLPPGSVLYDPDREEIPDFHRGPGFVVREIWRDGYFWYACIPQGGPGEQGS